MNDQPESSVPIRQQVESILARLTNDKNIQRSLPGGGALHFDRRLPFLCVYRKPRRSDAGVDRLLAAEPAYLIYPGSSSRHRALEQLLAPLVTSLSDHFGGFLLVELWTAGGKTSAQEVDQESGEPLRSPPRFHISAAPIDPPKDSLDVLSKALRRIKIARLSAEVRFHEGGEGRPPNMKALLPAATARRHGIRTIGIEVHPIFRDGESGELYPRVLRRLRQGIGRALKRTYFTFARAHTNIRPQHYYTLGRRRLVKTVWEIDRQLAEFADSFEFLLQVTPTNIEAAWREFKRGRFDQTPEFHYRPLPVEPSHLKRRLYDITIEKIDDPTIAYLFLQKQEELDRKITMMGDVGTWKFLLGSRQVFGAPSEELCGLALGLLDRIGAHSREETTRGQVSAEEFARAAEAEVAAYNKLYSGFTARVEIRDDMYTGLLTSRGNLLIGRNTHIPSSRVEPLLHHEVGTHSLTYFNGRAQPFQELRVGLCGYDGLQEGLAVLSEYLCGGLSRPRLRLLAARVVAVDALVRGASFVETFRLLDRTHEFAQRTAFTITSRVFRGGGLTKDLVYLQGLVQILEYLQTGGDLDPLFIGKIAAEHIPLVNELRMREVLTPPPLRPRYLDDPPAQRRLERVREGMTVLQLLEESRR